MTVELTEWFELNNRTIEFRTGEPEMQELIHPAQARIQVHMEGCKQQSSARIQNQASANSRNRGSSASTTLRLIQRQFEIRQVPRTPAVPFFGVGIAQTVTSISTGTFAILIVSV